MIRKSMPAPVKRGLITPGHGVAPQNAYLIIFTDIKKEATVIKLDGNMSLGREVPGNTPDISLDSPIVSRKHGLFTVNFDGFYYQDTDSFNGTFINGILYKRDENPCRKPIKLNDGDVLRLDNRDVRNSHADAVTIVFSTSYDKRSKWRRAKLKAASNPIGLSRKNLLELDSSQMAYHYADVTLQETGCMLCNTAHRNNIWYNNRPMTGHCFVRSKDVFRVNQNYLFYDKGEILYNICLVTEPGLDVHLAETHVADKMKKKVLLKDIHVTIDKGDFALIIGGSGAGKSTFMNSVLGKYNTIGTISIGGRPTSGNSELTSGIAYVPQTLPIRKEERLIDVVTDTCILRCKRKMSKTQRTQFIMNTLDSLGLKGKANMEIKKLSGGEQRRAAIANEVVTDADIFFLDEPDSGLDPKSGIELMNNLKALSDIGKMVMLISHNYASYPSPEQIYTKVIILAKSNRDGIGRLAFCGSVPEALDFFDVEALKDITKLINPVSENGEGRADEFVEKYRRMHPYG
ncbi:MAG: ATP-binding cassette domain-containing protein [Clostridia bacterium]|nr:ATP-binding cassette domain-containing protein [Clostridia bacterium]